MKNVAPIKNVLVGADVELFLREKETNKIISAEPFIKGTKYEPYQFDPASKYFAISLDNVLAEFSIPPVNHVDDWVKNLLKSLDYINSNIPERLCTVAQPAAILDMEFLQTENAQRFGCEPDYNVYLRAENNSPKADNNCLRSAGGHVHVGYEGATAETEEGLEQCESIIKALDLFLGIPSVIQEPDNDRKKLYGKAGAFRFKQYGVEYRTMSNYYLQSEQLMKWVFKNTMAAINFINDGRVDELEVMSDLIVDSINNNNKMTAERIVRQFEIELAA